MGFGTNKTHVEVIKEGAFILETFILVLLENGTENHGNNLTNWKILIRSIIVQIIMMWVSINMVLNAEYR